MTQPPAASASPFDQVFDRAAFHAEKYTRRKTIFGREDVLPLWVADMDLPSPPFALDAIVARMAHPLLGYTSTPPAVVQAIVDWQAQYGYAVDGAQLVFSHNLVNAVALTLQAFTAAGDGILIQPPVYNAFFRLIAANGRRAVEAPLCLEQQRYHIDFDAFERSIVDQRVTMFLLCNPHNPSGRVWTKNELQRMAEICLKHRVLIVADEIHGDLVFQPDRHLPLASLSSDIAAQTVTLNSPGKTFNLGGLQIGYALIANPRLRKTFTRCASALGIESLPLCAQSVIPAVYSAQGRQWRDAVVTHVRGNIDRLEQFFSAHLSQVGFMRPQASYLVWLDFRALFARHSDLSRWLIERAQLGLSDGEIFGGASGAGTGFMRINLALPSPVLDCVIQQLQQALPHLEQK